MRELNEMELEEVAGGFQVNFGTQANAGSNATAVAGFTHTSSVTDSTQIGPFSNSFAASHGTAFGFGVSSTSVSQSSAGLQIVG